MHQPEYHMYTYSLENRTSRLVEWTADVDRRVRGWEASLKVYNIGVDYGIVKYDNAGNVAESALMSDAMKEEAPQKPQL